MRFVELIDGFFQLPITEEEDELVSKFKDEPLAKNKLNEREREIARKLTSRGILSRIKQENELYYKLNILTEET